MRLLCLGDLAVVGDAEIGAPWPLPLGPSLDGEARVLFNWELPFGITVNPERRSSGERFLAHPRSIELVADWSPGFAALATNHILDGGPNGLKVTLERLKSRGFLTLGAGLTPEEISRPASWETKEGRLAMVNWVFPETHPDWRAVPGPACWPGIEEARLLISDLKHKNDWVLVIVHWSDEHFAYPRPEDRTIAAALAAMGADLVIGHHPHVVRGMEQAGDCPVFYSLGNFFFSDIARVGGGWAIRQAPRNREGLGVEVTFKRGVRPAWRLRSFLKLGTGIVDDSRRRAERHMRRASRPLERLQADAYSEWYATKRRLFDRFGYRLLFRPWQMGWKGLAQFPYRFLRSDGSRRRAAIAGQDDQHEHTPD